MVGAKGVDGEEGHMQQMENKVKTERAHCLKEWMITPLFFIIWCCFVLCECVFVLLCF